MLPRSISLAAQLLLAFVGLVVGTTVVLTLFAYQSSLKNLEADARRSARIAAEERAHALARLFASRQQRAEGFLASAELLCAEPRTDGRLGWSTDCVQTLMHQFRETERAIGVMLLYNGTPLVRSGRTVDQFKPASGALASPVWREGRPFYRMRALRGDAQLLSEFDNSEVAPLFEDRSRLGAAGEVFVTDTHDRFLTSGRYASTQTPAGARITEPLGACRATAAETVGLDYRGVKTIHGFRPVREIGGCIDAHIAYAEAMAPAEELRAELIARGIIFAVAGALLSLIAAHRISTPVRRLMFAAEALQAGQFSRPVPVGGPTEVRALSRAFSTMATALSQLVSREQTARQEAERANNSKDEFLATVSHELRTPLTAILGWARLMRDAHLDEAAAARAVAAIERNAEAQRRLVDDLLDVSRIVRGELHFDRTLVPLVAAVDAALEAVSPQAAEKGVAIERSLEDTTLAVLGDRRRLEQIVWNLVWNAVKFTPSGGRVRVAVRRRDRLVDLVVSDTGIGIDREFLPHVFDWFRQADAAPTRAHAGLGLGLGLVRQIAELHGGRVQAESAGQGRGSTFTVTLPLHDRHIEMRRQLPRPRPQGMVDLRAIRVLVVDDDTETVEALRAVLEYAGAVVDTASDAVEGRRELQAWHPDVLVSDIAMPVEDGYAFVRSLRDAHVGIPAIALTAYARRDDIERALAAGFQVHLAKPVDPTDLVETIANLTQRLS
jgi:signal transduction histidine kinase